MLSKKFVMLTEWFPSFSDFVSIRIVAEQAETTMHSHECGEIVIIFDGSATHNCEKMKQLIKKGDVLFIPEGLSHAYEKTNNLYLTNILFLQKRLNFFAVDIAETVFFKAIMHNKMPHEISPCIPVCNLSHEQLNYIQQLITTLKLEIEEQNTGHRSVRLAIFIIIIIELIRAYDANDAHKKNNQTMNSISKIITYMYNNYANDISLEMLYKKSNLSRTGFIEEFKSHTGKTPINFLLYIRIQKAISLLQGTNEAISSIAYTCGFNDCNYFSRQMKKITGKSPKQIRIDKNTNFIRQDTII